MHSGVCAAIAVGAAGAHANYEPMRPKALASKLLYVCCVSAHLPACVYYLTFMLSLLPHVVHFNEITADGLYIGYRERDSCIKCCVWSKGARGFYSY